MELEWPFIVKNSSKVLFFLLFNVNFHDKDCILNGILPFKNSLQNFERFLWLKIDILNVISC